MEMPPVNASLTAHKRPKRTKATRIESSVNDVRIFFRLRLLQMRERNFIAVNLSILWLLGGELAFVQVNRARGARGRMRIVRDHDNGLTLLLVQGLQEAQDFVAGFSFQVASRLVAK